MPFFLIFFAAVVTYAVGRGGGPERAAAITYLIALAGSATAGFIHIQGHFRAVSGRLFVVDVLMLIALSAIALRANRWWIIPAASCQLVAVMAHAAKLVDASMFFISYGLLTKIWSWPMVALLALGTWAHRRRIAEGTITPDWKPSFARVRSRSLPWRQPS